MHGCCGTGHAKQGWGWGCDHLLWGGGVGRGWDGGVAVRTHPHFNLIQGCTPPLPAVMPPWADASKPSRKAAGKARAGLYEARQSSGGDRRTSTLNPTRQTLNPKP